MFYARISSPAGSPVVASFETAAARRLWLEIYSGLEDVAPITKREAIALASIETRNGHKRGKPLASMHYTTDTAGRLQRVF